MNRRGLPLNPLRSFDAVARHLSFSRAAEELGVTHGAVSRQVAALEAQLGARLLDRGAVLALTDAGHELFDGVGPAFDRLAAAMDRVGAGERPAVLNVNAPPTFTIKWLIPRLSGFQRRHRDIDVRLFTGTGALRSVKMNDFDVIIRRLPDVPREPPGVPFLSGELAAVCAPELLEGHAVDSPADLGRHPLIEAATSAVTWSDWFAHARSPLPAQARFVQLEEMFLALQAALEGLGIALIPATLVADDLGAGRLVQAWPAPGLHERDYCRIVSPLSRQPVRAGVFAEWLDLQGEQANDLLNELTGA